MVRGEMEWEFSDAGDGSGSFLATGKVITFLRAHLARGEMDQAVRLYESCVENVGDDLLAEFTASSTKLKKSMANMFYRARDYKRAAHACEHLEEWEAAAKAHEAAFNYQQAADCYLRVKDHAKAAAIHLKTHDYRRAAELYHQAGDLRGAALAFERAGDAFGAAQLSLKAGDARGAARQLATIPPGAPRYTQSVAMLADVLIQLGRADVALQRLEAALEPDAPIADAHSAEILYRLGVMLAEQERKDDARAAFDRLRAYNPQYKDLEERVRDLAPATPRIHAAPSEPPTLQELKAFDPARAAPAPSVEITISGEDQFAALDGNVFAPRGRRVDQDVMSYGEISVRPRGSSGTSGSGSPFVTRMQGYDLLKTLPIFEDLSLDEMKDFYHLCEQVEFDRGEVIIEQGQPGQALIIVREGALRVSKVDDGKEITIATLPAGKYVGEMSLIDEGPTSARVTAADPVKALRIRKEAFQGYLFTHDLVALRIYRSFTATLVERLRDANEKLSARG